MDFNFSSDNDVAVVGIGLRFPGNVNSPQQFWEALEKSFDGIMKVPKERWSDTYLQHQLISTENAGLLDLDEWKKFDPLFFEISPKDAVVLDPQERMMLTLAYEALEDAQIPVRSLRQSNTGVFVGVSIVDYYQLQASYCQLDPTPKVLCDYFTHSVIANRVSYCFDFRGPSMCVDTACSSSLTSTDLAIKYIQDGECDIALSCGTNAIFDPNMSRLYNSLGVLGEHCCPFDQDANGFVRGEGCGVVVLKKLSLAERDGNRIYAVIKGRGVNDDGHCNKDTMSTPSSTTQSQNIKQTLQRSKIDASKIYYVEAHSTGTVVGDPIEVNSLIDVFSQNHSPERPLKIGSVKSNIGHLESAAGIASLIKVSLMLKNRKLVPTIKLSNLNSKIPFKQSNIQVVTQIEDLPNDQLIMMGINSFGIGGSNSHLILQEYKDDRYHLIQKISDNKNDKYYLVPISANSSTSNDKYFESIKEYQDRISLKEFALYQSLTKSFHSQRRVIIAKDWNDFNSKSIEINGQSTIKDSIEKKLIFVFCGQGPQSNQMGMNLYENEPIFKSIVDKLDSLLKEYSGYSLIEKMKQIPNDSNDIHKPIIAQPALFLFQVALFELYRHFGLNPSVVFGHSFGDITSAYISGNLTLSDAIKVVHLRASFQNETIGSGRMLVVGISSDQFNNNYQNQFQNLEIACYNSNNSIVITGNNNDLNEFAKQLKQSDIYHTFLRTPCSFHSSHQDVIKDKVINEINDLKSKQSTIPWYSTVTGDLKTDGIDSQYIYENIRNPVYFKKTLDSIARDLKDDLKDYVFIEISPHPTLSGLITQTIPSSKVISPIQRNKDEQLLFKSSLATLHCIGVNIDFKSQFNQFDISNPIWRDNVSILPRYQWDSDIYWRETHFSRSKRSNGPSTSILGRRSVFNGNECYLSDIDIGSKPFEYLKDHQVKDRPILPGAAYIEAIIEIFQSKQQDILIDRLEFIKPFFFNQNGQSQKLMTNIEKISKFEYSIDFFNKNSDYYDLNDEWFQSAKSSVTLLQNPNYQIIDIESFKNQCNLTTFTQEELYKKTLRLGLRYGPAFQHIKSISIGNQMSFSVLQTKSTSNTPSKILNSTLIDNCSQGLIGIIDDRRHFIFKSIDEMRINHQIVQELELNPPDQLFLLTKVVEIKNYECIGNCLLVHPNGQLILEMKRFTVVTNERMKMNKIKYPNEELFETFYQLKESQLSNPNEITPSPLIEDSMASLKINEYRPDAIKIIYSMFSKNIPEFNLDEVLNQSIEESMIRFKFISKESNIKLFSRMIEILNDGEEFLQSFNLTDLKIIIDYPSLFEGVDKGVQLIIETLRGNDEYGQQLFKDGVISNIYKSQFIQYYFKQTSFIAVESILKSIQQSNSKRIIKILEIGGGTGTVTNYLIPQLDEMLYSLGNENQVEVVYTFSDVSSFFVNPMKDKYTKQFKFKSNLKMKFKVIDLDQDLVDQGLLKSSYDMIIMSLVIHVCPNIRSPISNCHQILSPNGILLFAEPAYKNIFPEMLFGGFKQYWSYNDDIRDHCALKPNQWVELLSEDDQFKNIRIYGPNDSNGNQLPPDEAMIFIIHCQKPKIEKLKINNIQQLSIIIEENQTIPIEYFERYSEQSISLIKINEIEFKSDILKNSTNILFLPTIEHQSIDKYQQTIFSLVELLQMFTYQENQPRITTVIKDNESSNYLSNSIIGLLNTAFVDHRELDLLIINIDSSLKIEYVHSIMQLSQNKESLGELHYGIINNDIMVYRDFNIKDDIFKYSNSYETNIENISTLANLNLDFKLRNRRELKPNEIEFEIKSDGLNFKDYLFNHQILPQELMTGGDIYHPPFGLESSGLVSRLGSNVKDFKVGDQVIGFHTVNSLASHSINDQRFFIQKQKNFHIMNVTQFKLYISSVYHSLFEVCNFNSEKDTVLIHGATGGVGIVALNVMRMLKCKRVYATAGSQEKIDYLKSEYSDILIDVFNSYSNEFADKIKQQCKGVDVLINTLPVEFMKENFKSMAPYGRIADLVVTHIINDNRFRYGQFRYDVKYSSVDIQYLFKHRIHYSRNLMKTIMNDLTSGRLQLTPIKVFDVYETKEAFNFMKERKQIGKIVIDCSNMKESIFKSLIESKERKPLPKIDFKLDISNTIIVTGQSGLSLELVTWLAKHTNASDIVVLSKSKLNNRLNHIINSIKSTRIHFYQTDITDINKLKSRIESISNSMPSIESIFHLAIILESFPINEVTFDNIKKVHDPKVVGAHNLHTISIDLRLPLKQFIVFSSISGFSGEASQPSYNSACLAVDALCKYRNNILGLKSKSIRLGPILGEGTVAESAGIKELFITRGIYPIPLSKFFGGLEVILSQPLYCTPMISNITSVCSYELHAHIQHGIDHLVFEETGKLNTSNQNYDPLETLLEGLSSLLSIPKQKLDAETPLKNFGVDSLMTVQVKVFIDTNIELDLFTISQIPNLTIGSIITVINRRNLKK
ncbi:putative polyketide synthase [Heterostelium album PN500]|uniref:Putative polyketide synthase n=1 Tax=Heterostelium pallidum (strain ATCC 26659 / Pp 5 / PN500) TaxID=670386 RepID=D3BR90_HETP5|nr:putative polyketide synthase [Heterostelium album PN500]EFA75922.1 putative polyketide synthase [Heterostelium album PN500]|eukprot:XP_020428056.1 putative polyketide synthase [Heterostelium album PN500]